MRPEFGVRNSQCALHTIPSQNIILFRQISCAKYHSDIKLLNVLFYPAWHNIQYSLIVGKFDIRLNIREYDKAPGVLMRQLRGGKILLRLSKSSRMPKKECYCYKADQGILKWIFDIHKGQCFSVSFIFAGVHHSIHPRHHLHIVPDARQVRS